jgi:Divergent InlB B-repeat domain
MKLKRRFPVSLVILAIIAALSVTFLVSAQVTSEQAQTLTGSYTLNNLFGSGFGARTYQFTMSLSLTGPQYVTYAQPGQITVSIGVTAQQSTSGLFPPTSAGFAYEFIGTNNSFAYLNIPEVFTGPSTSPILLASPDYFGNGQADFQVNPGDGQGQGWTFSPSIQVGPFGLQATPPNPTVNGPVSLQTPATGFNEIDLVDTLDNADTPVGAYKGLFSNNGSISLNGALIYEATNGTADIGTCSINVAMTYGAANPGGAPFYYGSKTANLEVQYVRGDHLINDNHPTLIASASPSPINPLQQETITVQIYNPSPDLATMNGTLQIVQGSLNGLSSPPAVQNISIAPRSTVTNTFQITPVDGGNYNPQIEFQTFWQAPVPAGVESHVIYAYAPFTVTTPNIDVTVDTSPVGLSFAVDGVNYTYGKVFSWPEGSSHKISTHASQNGGPGVQYTWNYWNNFGAISQTLSLTNGTTLTANFNAQYFLTMNAGMGGSVSPGSSWTGAGNPVQISATANNGYRFSGWTGNGVGSYSGNSSSTFIQMNTPITETAAFTVLAAPIFSLVSVTGNQFQATLSGLFGGEQVVLEASPDLKNWSPVQTNTAAGPTLTFTNLINPAQKGQYFRATAN